MTRPPYAALDAWFDAHFDEKFGGELGPGWLLRNGLIEAAFRRVIADAVDQCRVMPDGVSPVKVRGMANLK